MWQTGSIECCGTKVIQQVADWRASVKIKITRMYLLTIGADGNRMGDIIPLGQLRSAVELTPSFGKQADHHRRLTKENNF